MGSYVDYSDRVIPYSELAIVFRYVTKLGAGLERYANVM